MDQLLIQGDSAKELKKLEDNTVDLLVTDPPYGISFMGKNWDKALPDKAIWRECLRVLKPGAFAFIMSAPRSDVLSRMILCLEEAGFQVGFTPIFWTYASGFPKAHNVGKHVDRKLGAEREVVGYSKGVQVEALSSFGHSHDSNQRRGDLSQRFQSARFRL